MRLTEATYPNGRFTSHLCCHLKVIIAGSRDFDNYDFLEGWLDYYLGNKDYIEIVDGEARGADTLGYCYALRRGLPSKSFPANWDKYGRSAGYKRNVQMADYGDCLIAFWDGISKGTKHMIDLAREKGLLCRVVTY